MKKIQTDIVSLAWSNNELFCFVTGNFCFSICWLLLVVIRIVAVSFTHDALKQDLFWNDIILNQAFSVYLEISSLLFPTTKIFCWLFLW